MILTSAEEDPALTWFHTRGMRIFGRPDISVRHVSAERHAAVVELCNRLIEMQAHGALIPDGQAVRMASLPAGGVMRTQGDVEDPDFNNLHLEITLG